jgi:GNAT superfamily N-acetyltransferase
VEPDLLRRVCDAVRGLRSKGGEVVETRLVTVVRGPARPDVWDANHALAVSARTREEIEEVFSTCDALLPATARHRQFHCDALTPEAFVAYLEFAGFEARASVQMVLLEALDAAERERRAPYAASVSLGLARLRRAAAPEVRTWITRREGEDCGTFASWPGRDGVGVVEWLLTHPRHRRRGVATALVAHAVDDARARGAGPVVIGPDAGPYDVPRRLYAALGFRPLCVTRSYTRSSNDPIA